MIFTTITAPLRPLNFPSFSPMKLKTPYYSFFLCFSSVSVFFFFSSERLEKGAVDMLSFFVLSNLQDMPDV